MREIYRDSGKKLSWCYSAAGASAALCGSLGSFGGGSLLGFFGGSCGSGLLLGDGLCALLLDLGFGSQACFLGRLGIRGELVALGLDLTGLLAQPFVEAGFGFGLRECALGDTA